MKITTKRTDFLNAVNIAATVVPTRTTLPSLTAVLLTYSDGELKVRGSDASSFSESFCEATGSEKGAFGVPASLLSHFLSSATAEDVSITLGQRAEFVCGTRRAEMVFQPESEFLTPKAVKGKFITMDAEKLHDALRRLRHASSIEESAFSALCSVAFSFTGENLELIGFDGKSLGVCSFPMEETGMFIVPSKLIASLTKIIDGLESEVFVTLSDAMVCFEGDTWKLSGVLKEGNFPNWHNLNIDDMNKCTVNRKELVSAIKSAIPFGQEAGFTRLVVHTKDNRLLIETQGQNASSESMEMTGGPLDFHAEGSRFLDMIDSLHGDTVTIEHLDEPRRGVVVREDNFIGALMPLNK